MTDIPERRENWAEATSLGGAKCLIALKSGHILVADEPAGFAGGAGGENAGPTPTGFLAAAFAADIPVVVRRIALTMGVDVQEVKARVTIAWNPRVIAGLVDGDPSPQEAVADVWLKTTASDEALEGLRTAYDLRCPLHNLFRKAGCRITENWHSTKS